jgi:hypothetical protein
MFAAATAWLERHIEQVNAVNVFPVPDGDTGTNMFLTMRSTMEEADRCTDPSAGQMLAAMSHGALMGARGNSGVILSQIIRGVANAGEGADVLDGADLASGLGEASSAAYRAVTKPTEGTILTVIRESAEAVASSDGRDVVTVLEIAVSSAREAVAKTPSLLPVLAEAGVVDAGGLGLSVLMEGMLRHLKGESLDMAVSEPLAATSAKAEAAVAQGWLAATERGHDVQGSKYGYCAEILITGSGLDVDAIRERILVLGDSAIVVGDTSLVRVHIHTDDPGAALSVGTSVGSVSQVKVDNIRKQAERFVEMHESAVAPAGPTLAAPPAAVSTVAVVAGDGMRSVFESVGCTRIVGGGPTMNPSTREILEAVESCPTEEVIVLPNDKNIIMAAELAKQETGKAIHVVPTRSMPQGIAALLALNPEEGAETNAADMEAARTGVKTIEITRAVRSTSIGGVKVEEGQVIAIVDDVLTLASDTPENAAMQALEPLAIAGTSLITLYYGAETTEAGAAKLAERLKERFPRHEFETVHGGQPHYSYIISLE